MEELVNWPGTLDLTDSGEGGLFAWMIVPEAMTDGDVPGPNVYGNNCHVDVTAYLSRPRLMINRPDVCVSPECSQVFVPYEHRNSWFDHSMTLEKLVTAAEGEGETSPLRRALFGTLGQDDLSVPLLVAVFLGSTHQSLWDARLGRYFQVTKETLTLPGQALYSGFQAVYGVDPVILTFLDT
jgi:hypothetical protein